MKKFPHGTLVKHRQNKRFVFLVLDELESVPPGDPSLYRCMPLEDEGSLYLYHENDLYGVKADGQKGSSENC